MVLLLLLLRRRRGRGLLFGGRRRDRHGWELGGEGWREDGLVQEVEEQQ